MEQRLPSIISLIGRQGSGKTTIGTCINQLFGYPHIEASSVVRKVCGDLPRQEMPKTNERTKDDPTWLGRAIEEEIAVIKPSDRYVITGIREQEVHDTLSVTYNVYVVEIYSGMTIRFTRLLGTKCKSWMEFQGHENNEARIGLTKLLQKHSPKFYTSYNTDPYQIAKSIVEIHDLEENIKAVADI